jgi:hypothetical protein
VFRRFDVAVVYPLGTNEAHSILNDPNLIIDFLINHPEVRYLLLDKACDNTELLKFFDQGVHESVDANGLPVWTIGKRRNPGKATLNGSFTLNDLQLVNLFVKPIAVESWNLAEEIDDLYIKPAYRYKKLSS